MFDSSRLENNGLVPFSWLKKKASSWSLVSTNKVMNYHNRLHSTSTLSLQSSLASVSETATITTTATTTTTSTSSSVTTTTSNSEQSIEEQLKELSLLPPPNYDDILLYPGPVSTTTTFQLPASYLNRVVVPREEEGNEVLPEYECTVEHTASLDVKCELSEPSVKSKNRSWRELCIMVYGTKIMAYRRHPSLPNNRNQKKKPEPLLWSHSMQNAKVSLAVDYFKRRHVFRLNIENGPQYLFTVRTEIEISQWISLIESSINISSDLDERLMPQFISLTSRRRRRNRNYSGAQ